MSSEEHSKSTSHQKRSSTLSPKLATLSKSHLHKMAAEALREGDELLYAHLLSLLSIPNTPLSETETRDRYHFHLRLANVHLKEHNLWEVTKQDAPSSTPFLPYVFYLSNLRSAHNVGSIFRTVEAFRCGSIALSPSTPSPLHKAVAATAKGAASIVPWSTPPLTSLPRPLIALETASNACSYLSFPFPKEATFLLGNEEYGLPEELLIQADACINIPLFGMKNSLNVANAVAVIASHLRSLFPEK